ELRATAGTRTAADRYRCRQPVRWQPGAARPAGAHGAAGGPAMTGRQPRIDYVTKDYEGFKQGMLNQIPLLLPDWTDRGEADFGVVLIELVAYVADILSYYQDRVANEAFLATATQRRSVTDLLRLIGYQIDPGLAAS